MIIDYKIILNADKSAVEDEVNASIKKGWQPHGSPIIAHGAEYNMDYILQAMVKIGSIHTLERLSKDV